MKLAPILEAQAVSPRRLALELQQQLLERFDSAIDDITLIKTPERPRWYSEGVTLKLTGPLVEFYLDLLKDTNVGSSYGTEWILQARTDKDEVGDGFIVSSSTSQDPSKWITIDRIENTLLSMDDLRDSHRYNYLWFDKIASNLPPDYKVFHKHVRNDVDYITTQIIRKGSNGVNPQPNDRFSITFEKVSNGYRFACGFYGASNLWVVRDLDHLKRIILESEPHD